MVFGHMSLKYKTEIGAWFSVSFARLKILRLSHRGRKNKQGVGHVDPSVFIHVGIGVGKNFKVLLFHRRSESHKSVNGGRLSVEIKISRLCRFL